MHCDWCSKFSKWHFLFLLIAYDLKNPLWNLWGPFLVNFEVKPFSKGRKWIDCNRFIRINHRPFIIEYQVVEEHNHLGASILNTNARMRTASECQISERGWSRSSKPRWIKSFWIREKFRGHVWAPNMPKKLRNCQKWHR